MSPTTYHSHTECERPSLGQDRCSNGGRDARRPTLPLGPRVDSKRSGGKPFTNCT